MGTEFLEVIPNGEARKRFEEAVARFREEGVGAAPVVFGNHRKPEGAMLSFSLFEELLPVIAEIQPAVLVRERLAGSLTRTYLPEFREALCELADSNLQRRVLTIWTDASKGLIAGIPLAHLASISFRLPPPTEPR